MATKYPWVKTAGSLGWTRASREGAYARARWRKLRSHKLDLNPLCEMCEASNRVTAATEVDHINAVSEELGENDPLFYDIDNLQGLCSRCHRIKTRIENSRYSEKNIEKGKLLMKKLEKK